MRKNILALFIISLFLATPAFASFGVVGNASNNVIGEATDLACGPGINCTLVGSLGTITNAGGIAVLTPATTISLAPLNEAAFSLVPAQNETINFASAPSGETVSLIITTSGVTSYTITFGTNTKTTGTLATGTTTAKVFTITFICDGVNCNEVARTVAM